MPSGWSSIERLSHKAHATLTNASGVNDVGSRKVVNWGFCHQGKAIMRKNDAGESRQTLLTKNAYVLREEVNHGKESASTGGFVPMGSGVSRTILSWV